MGTTITIAAVRRKTVWAIVLAFAVAWTVLMCLKMTTDASDVPRYTMYGEAMKHGLVPYRDFSVEYPPGALVPFVLPALAGDGHRAYRIAFEVLMALCGGGLILATAAILDRLGDALSWRLAFVGAGMVALGPIALGHFDLWPALLAALGMAALLRERRLLSALLLGIAVAAKIYAAVLVPLAFVWWLRNRSARDAWTWFAAMVGTVFACFLPFLAVAPHGVVESLRGQADRPLQLESSAAAGLLALHQIAALSIGVEFSHASVNLGGKNAAAAAAAATIAEIAVLVLVWVRFARGRVDARSFVQATAAAVLAFVALGKVFSPQFLLWLIPLAPLLGGAAAVCGCAAVGTAVVLTRLYFPGRWRGLIHLEATPTWLLVARDLLLVALLAALLLAILRTPTATWPSLRRRLPAASRSNREPQNAPARGS